MSMRELTIVLSRTSHPGNIGACARAMKTMCIKDLRLVNCVPHDDKEAYSRSSGAEDILFQAQTFATLEEALSDCHLVLGTSARPRTGIHVPVVMAQHLPTYLSNEKQRGRIAVVFGNEQSGLDNHELALCERQIIVPTNPDFSSLNLASCVQLISFMCMHNFFDQAENAYQAIDKKNDKAPATQAQLHALTATIATMSLSKHAHKLQKDSEKLLQLLMRMHPNSDEVDFLHGIFKRIGAINKIF